MPSVAHLGQLAKIISIPYSSHFAFWMTIEVLAICKRVLPPLFHLYEGVGRSGSTCICIEHEQEKLSTLAGVETSYDSMKVL